ncbi:hypothetical protein [Paeniglutamicibacter sp. Y32M11]|uniref:hypothetical protein n=1 Tax=Paeniglutamicibacter sp. Y32M11 TaxID=2853258 RepID=UPI001C533145|nr:hypothetical protein [Paeniglutamicibacter sp. Y32M11]QXQ10388.1 hypothetical protein KUF55_18565 [Paeniglutamicibacter sp. Y32M11]
MDDLQNLDFALSYQTLTVNIRALNLRPVCQSCMSVLHWPNANIEYPTGEEAQSDWLESSHPPAGWGTKKALLVVGYLAHSVKWWAVLAPSMDQPHPFEAMITCRHSAVG